MAIHRTPYIIHSQANSLFFTDFKSRKWQQLNYLNFQALFHTARAYNEGGGTRKYQAVNNIDRMTTSSLGQTTWTIGPRDLGET